MTYCVGSAFSLCFAAQANRKGLSVTADEDIPACHKPCCYRKLHALHNPPRAVRMCVKTRAIPLLLLHPLWADNSPSSL